MTHLFSPPPIDFLDPRPVALGGTAGRILEEATTAAADGRPIVIRAICRHLGLAPGAPYSHFGSSSQLESVVVYNGLLTLARWITERSSGAPSPRARLVAACHAYRTWALDNPHLFGFVLPTAGRTHDPTLSAFIHAASQALAIPATRALRDGWDSGDFSPPSPGPAVHPLMVDGVVSLDSSETREANALWIMVHGAVVIELSIGTHDGWDDGTPVFDWLIESHISAHLDHQRH